MYNYECNKKKVYFFFFLMEINYIKFFKFVKVGCEVVDGSYEKILLKFRLLE